MHATEKIWFNGALIPWNDAKIHVLTHTLHYGSGAFEGIRMYKTANGSAIFQLDRHIDRLYYSAESIQMKVPWSKKEFKQAVIETVRVNKMEACYIRPIFYYGYGELRVGPDGCPVEGAIAVWPWGAYLSNDPIRVKVADLIRIHPRSCVADAKITGHYTNAMLAGLQATNGGYHEALLLDYAGNIAEGPGENFFMVKDGILITPPLGCILSGITRASVITLARDFEIAVVERPIPREEVFTADECFFTGTAAEVTPISSLDDIQLRTPFGPVTRKIKNAFTTIVQGENPRYDQWLTFI